MVVTFSPSGTPFRVVLTQNGGDNLLPGYSEEE
jgi:hypothetical protein